MAKILLLTHEFAPFRGGIAAVADGLATGAAAVGHKPMVLAPDYGVPNTTEDDARPYRVRRFDGSQCSVLSVRKLSAFARRCAEAIRDTRPDLVHAVDPPAQMALTMLARLGKVGRYVFTVHGTELLRYRSDLVPRLWMGRGMHRVANVHAVSGAVHRMLYPHGMRGPRHAFVEHPGIVKSWLEQPPAPRTETRARWGASDDDFVLLTLSRRVPDKGHADVIAASGLLADSLRRRIVYVVVGNGPAHYANRLREAAAAAGIRLLLPGMLSDEDAIAACDAADLFVMLSYPTATRLEGFGIAYVEAAARGLPSLARATGGVAEAVAHGETGFVLPEEAGPETIAPSIEILMRDRDLRQRLGTNGRLRAPHFSWPNRAEAVYRRFFEQI